MLIKQQIVKRFTWAGELILNATLPPNVPNSAFKILLLGIDIRLKIKKSTFSNFILIFYL